MAFTNTETQRRFKARMYEAGFCQKQVWVKRGPVKAVKMDRGTFIKKMDRLASGWDEASLSQLFNLLIEIAKAKKGVARTKK